jgi:hypothetical protein
MGTGSLTRSAEKLAALRHFEARFHLYATG